MSDAATMLGTIDTVQLALSVIQSTLALTVYEFPASCSPSNGSSWDFIIVGGGSAGSVLASRLSENSSVNVLLIESGGYLPIESELPGVFTLLPQSNYDYNISSENDNYTAQNLQDSTVSLTQGKMLGGSSALYHMIHVQGNEHDYEEWVNITGDDSWSYENVLPYFIKMEQLYDEEILNSTYAQYHGTSGYMKIAREPNTKNQNYLTAFKELGHTVKLDVSGPQSLGYSEPLFNIADGVRQSNALAYLGPAKNRSNLCVALSTTVSKILISNSTATGVQAVDSNNNVLVVNANNEVILSAGAINSPKLLMLSGVGPKEQLETLGITVVKDLPVGENFQDHLVAAMVYQMEASDSASVTNPHKFPVPTTTGYVAVDSSQSYPDYQTINLVFPHDSAGQLQLCSKVFKYNNDICQNFYDASNGHETLLVVHNLLKPKSRGYLNLTSSDYTVAPSVHTGAYSNSSDLTLMGKCLADFNQVLNTTYFTSVNASFVDPGLCSSATTDTEFWECYALAMSATMWHYSGTCAMGSVVDSYLKVKGIDALRVVDSSTMPTLTSGNINAVVTMIAEKVSALIKSAWEID